MRLTLGKQSIAPIASIGVVGIMLVLVAISPAMYRAFCSLTGYEGTPRIGAVQSALKGTRVLHVRFDANVASNLPWTFEPETPALEVRTGKTATAFYRVTNRSDETIVGRAAYNVGPPSMGAYFDKIACFCFSEQTLKPHQSLEMPVVFVLDPALEADETTKGVEEVVLSYTFYRQKGPSLAGAPEAKRAF
jgi:cytochrome c oxidase assembly protein subunit 11